MLYFCAVLVSSFIFISFLLFFFNDTATTEIYTLSLHDALPIYAPRGSSLDSARFAWLKAICANCLRWEGSDVVANRDRKSTRLNSSHTVISYAVFCLKKKKKKKAYTKITATNTMAKQKNKHSDD